MRQEMDFVGVGVGNYQICFDENFVVPLNAMQEDKIIYTDKKNYIVLRHAFVDLSMFAKLSKMHDNKIKLVNCNHIDMLEDGEFGLISSSFTSCNLKYVSWENDCESFSSCKIVIEFDNMDAFRKIEKCTKEGVILK